jgi:hypothetical protein
MFHRPAAVLLLSQLEEDKQQSLFRGGESLPSAETQSEVVAVLIGLIECGTNGAILGYRSK